MKILFWHQGGSIIGDDDDERGSLLGLFWGLFPAFLFLSLDVRTEINQSINNMDFYSASIQFKTAQKRCDRSTRGL